LESIWLWNRSIIADDVPDPRDEDAESAPWIVVVIIVIARSAVHWATIIVRSTVAPVVMTMVTAVAIVPVGMVPVTGMIVRMAPMAVPAVTVMMSVTRFGLPGGRKQQPSGHSGDGEKLVHDVQGVKGLLSLHEVRRPSGGWYSTKVA